MPNDSPWIDFDKYFGGHDPSTLTEEELQGALKDEKTANEILGSRINYERGTKGDPETTAKEYRASMAEIMQQPPSSLRSPPIAQRYELAKLLKKHYGTNVEEPSDWEMMYASLPGVGGPLESLTFKNKYGEDLAKLQKEFPGEVENIQELSKASVNVPMMYLKDSLLTQPVIAPSKSGLKPSPLAGQD